MTRQHFFIVSVFLVFILVTSGVLCAQRVIDLDKIWGDMRVLGAASEDKSGSAVAYGDINGDGFDDIIIGAACADPGDPARANAGETYVIFGSSFPSPPYTIDLSTDQADITICGDNTGDGAGSAVASGDINCDGYDDIIIGATGADPGDPARSDAGETYVIFGSSFPSPPYTIDLSTTSADITVCGAAAADWSGWALASGDVDGDGYDDIIISAPEADPGGRTAAGETYVIFGGSLSSPPYTIDLSTTPADITVCGAGSWDYSGYAVASGDINSDAYDDIIIGAPTFPPHPTLLGETYVIFGGSFSSPPYTIDLSTTPAGITVCGAAAEDYIGKAVASGDVNSDGYDEIIIGAPYADPGDPPRSGAGETYVIFGSNFLSPPYTIDLSTSPANITVCGAGYGDLSGYAVASGDVNGDGYDDIITSACLANPDDPPRDGAGETYVIFGSSSPPTTIDLSTQSADICICGDDAYDWSGYAVASGDVNGDGYDDMIIGANNASPPAGYHFGETYLIAGGGAFITAHGLGGKSWVKEFNLLTNSWNSFKAFGAVNSQGEVHLSIGDIDADKLDEIAAGQGEGAKSWVKFFEVDGSLISTFKAFGAANTSGELHLALGNFDADTADKEIAIAQGEGGQSWVKTFETDGTLITSFKAFGAANAQGEVHVAAGDLENADGIDEIVVGMGEGGTSRVKIFNYDGTVIRSFAAFDSTDNPGGEVRLAVGNFDADADLEIAAATGYNGGNLVRLFEKDGTLIKQFLAFGFGGNTNGDVQITASDTDNDGVDEIICAHGEGGSSQVKVFKADGTSILSFKAFGGVNAQGEVHLGRSNY
ncbi:MAG: hypothetical protein OEZ30_07920 [Candidatus Aminicenantes bacterium]|nr:hypothetical protein [Candidatus Aminicenantes bacterium]MDH5715474.1 hypothetical protein [Candidatus Aminicenantes bacterium]